MELIIKHFHSLPCRLEVFTINGKGADQDDFGDMYDHEVAVLFLLIQIQSASSQD